MPGWGWVHTHGKEVEGEVLRTADQSQLQASPAFRNLKATPRGPETRGLNKLPILFWGILIFIIV